MKPLGNPNILAGKRVSYGLSQNEMAEKLNMSTASYRRKETGTSDFSAEQMLFLKEFFDLTLNEFDLAFYKGRLHFSNQ